VWKLRKAYRKHKGRAKVQRRESEGRVLAAQALFRVRMYILTSTLSFFCTFLTRSGYISCPAQG